MRIFVYLALLVIQPIRQKPTTVKPDAQTVLYCPCINVAQDLKQFEPACNYQVALYPSDTASYQNDYFSRHKQTGRAVWVRLGR